MDGWRGEEMRDLKRPQGVVVISWGERLHHGRRPRAEEGEVVAVTTFHSHGVHQPLAWNSNLQLPKTHTESITQQCYKM
jgi:hypothetical protein